MSIYKKIYHNLCEKHSHLKEEWQPESGLHRHHIKPKHSGGTDVQSNYTYLTIKKHIIAHWLLWKIYGNINDKKSFILLKGCSPYRGQSNITIDGIIYKSKRDACTKLKKSLRTIQRWAKSGESKKYNFNRKGSYNNGKSIIIDGICYVSRNDAARRLNMTGYAISKFI